MLTVNLHRPSSWKTFYDLQTALLLLLLGFLPTVGFIAEWLGKSALFPAAAIYGGVLLFVQRRAIDWKCPRCGKAFLRARGNGFASPFRKRCGSCGLRRGAVGE